MSMWRPLERIRHDAIGGHWPSAREAEQARLFQSVRVGRLALNQRTWVPAMVPWRATEQWSGCGVPRGCSSARRREEGGGLR